MSVIDQGIVDWSGENPGIYLKNPDQLDGPWVALAVYFKVVYSAYGRGRGIVVLGAPDIAAGYPDAPNLCLSDNLPLMRHLLDAFVPNYGAFREVPGLKALTLLEATGGGSDTSDPSGWSETLTAGDTRVTMRWAGLGKPFAAKVGVDQTATGRHEMYSLFQGASDGQILLDGKALPGTPIERDFLGGRLSSAFLAFAESWVVPGADHE